MADFNLAYAPLKQYEGGYSNNPSDKGGETYGGIARNFFPAWPGWIIIDELKKNGLADHGLNFALSKNSELNELVSTWYKQEWWDKMQIANFPQELANELFEQAVNLGRSGAGKYLQRLINAFNRNRQDQYMFSDLIEDGVIGQRTLSALKNIIADRAKLNTFITCLNDLQSVHYINLAAKNFSQRKFLDGWLKRT